MFLKFAYFIDPRRGHVRFEKIGRSADVPNFVVVRMARDISEDGKKDDRFILEKVVLDGLPDNYSGTTFEAVRVLAYRLASYLKNPVMFRQAGTLHTAPVSNQAKMSLVQDVRVVMNTRTIAKVADVVVDIEGDSSTTVTAQSDCNVTDDVEGSSADDTSDEQERRKRSIDLW
jgi:hypothetical protein